MEKYFGAIKSADLFKDIEQSNFKSLLACLSARITHYSKNQTVFTNDSNVKRIGIVLLGQIRIIKEDYYGNRNIISDIEAGDLFGETLAFADVDSLSVSAYCVTDSDILFVDYRKIFSPCCKACVFHNKLTYNMLHIIALKNISLNQKIEIISRRSTSEKILAYLSAEAQRAGSNSFSIPFNRQELADYLYVDRSAMSSELSKLRDKGVLNYSKNRFELLKKNLPNY